MPTPRPPSPPPTEPQNPLALDPGEESARSSPTPRPQRTPGPGLTPDGRLRSGKLANLSMPAAIWVLSWPILAESFLNSTVGLTDTILAAQISTAATDAIGAASYVMWFVGLLAMAVGVGATALVSRAVGASRMAVAHAATAQGVLLAALVGCFGGLLLAAVAPVAAGMLNLSAEGTAAFNTYLRIIALGVPAMSILAVGIACARGAGDSARPLLAMVIVNVVNIALAWLLSGVDYSTITVQAGVEVRRVLLTNPSPIRLGISGVAWGTVIAEWVGAAVVLLILARGSSGVRLSRRRLRPHWHTLRRLVRVAVPNLLETLGMWFGNFLVILLVGMIALARGEGMMGSHILAVRIESFSYLPGFAMGTAAAALAGQYLGAGSPALARRAVLRCTLIASAIMGLAGVVFILIPRTLVGLISSQPVHLAEAPRLLVICGFVQVPFAISNVLRSALRGVGDGRVVMYLVWACTYLVRLPLAFALSGVDLPLPGGGVIPNPFGLEPSLSMLWVALCVEIAVRCLLFAWRFGGGKWMTLRV